MSAVRALLSTIWQRNSRWLLAIGAYFVLYSQIIVLNGNDQRHPAVFAVGTLILVFCYLGLVGIFLYQDSDVGVRGSAYPAHMLTLPVKTFKLVMLPMVLGTVALLGTGLIFSKIVHAQDGQYPLYWPAMLITAILAMLQAIFWYPLGVPYSKLILTLLGIPVMIGLKALASSLNVGETAICQGLGIFTMVCYAVAYHGVVRARRGDIQMFTLRIPAVQIIPKRAVKWLSFKDKFAAQRWYEWRQQGLILPCLVAFVCLAFYIPSLWNNTESIVYVLREGSGTVPMIPTFAYTYLPLVIYLVPISALIVGCGARRSDVKHSDRTFHLFFGTRPMSDAALVGQKLMLALKSSIVAWGFVLVLFLFQLPQQGRKFYVGMEVMSSERYSVYTLLKPYMTSDVVLMLFCVSVLLVIVTWRNYAIGFWTELSGKIWLRYGYPILLLTLCFGLPAAFGNFRGFAFEVIIKVALGIIWFLILLRFAAGAILVRRQLQSGVMNLRTLKAGIVAYLIAYSVLVPMILYCTRAFHENFSEYYSHSKPMTIMLVIGMTVLWIPFIRLLLATEMLHQNRHRA